MSSVNLRKISALPISFHKNGVVFGKSMVKPELEIKSYNKYRRFFKNQKLDNDQKMYYIYRNSCLRKDLPVFKKYGLRYDITAILPGNIGDEPIRTIGHIHKNLGKIGQPNEIYQVLYGTALFLLHNIKTETIYPIQRNAGQKIVIPGNCAHITINNSPDKPLIIANIFTNKKNVSDYKFFEKTSGPAWYPTRNKNKITFVKNPKAAKNLKISSLYKKCSLPKGISQATPLYEEFINNPDRFAFLSQPNRFKRLITFKNLF